jgi:hypothetical protein
MKTIAMLLLLTSFVWAAQTFDSPQSGTPGRTMSIDREAIALHSNSVLAWNCLLTMSAADRANSSIELELQSGASEKALRTSHSIENLWNSGRYQDALNLFEELAKQTDLRGLAIGNSWRVPVPTQQETVLWGTDVRIGNRDSLLMVNLDIERDTGHLFAVLAGPKDGGQYWYVNFSTDNGNSWSETYSWWSGMGEQLNSVSAAVADSYCFVAYTGLTPQTEARIRRFNAYTGAMQFFPGSIAYITVAQTTNPVYIKEVSITANQEAYDNRLYFMLITSAGSLRYLWSIASDGTAWTEVSTGVTNASRGLDATFNQGYVSRYFFVSYYDTSNNLHILGHDAVSWYDQLQVSAGVVTSYSSISAYGDIVICVFDYYDTQISCKYRISRDAGDSWNTGEVDSLTLRSECPDVTAKLGAGLAMTYRYYTTPRQERFAYRNYDPGPWPTRAVFADYEPYPNKPSIEYLGSATYGIVYLKWYSPDRAAYFDKSTIGCSYAVGDINNNGATNGIDITYGVSYLKGGAAPPVNCGIPVGPCPEASPYYAAGDVNGNCAFNGIDITYFVSYLKGGAALTSCYNCPPVASLVSPAKVTLPEATPGLDKISQSESGE